jgi:hypothetical protein
MLARAVVVESRWPVARLTKNFRPALSRRVVGAASEIAFLEIDVAEHSSNEVYMLGLTAVGGARNGELFVAPVQCVERARAEKRNYLEWLGA